MFKQLDRERLVGLFVLGWLLFGYPVLGLWDGDATLGGVPVFVLGVFGVWAALIALLAWLMERAQPDGQGGSEAHGDD